MVNWKVIAIVFIILFVLQTLGIIWATVSVIKEDQKTMECYYEICEEYPDALYESGLCTCYDYDLLGNLIPSKYEVMD